MKVLLDANFLMLPVQFKIDVFRQVEELFDEPVEFFVPRPVLDELKALKGKDRLKARAMVQFVEKRGRVKVLEERGRPDELLLKHARKWKGSVWVATGDKSLRKLLKQFGAGVLLLREKAQIVKG